MQQTVQSNIFKVIIILNIFVILDFCHNKLTILAFVTYKLSDFIKSILSSIIFIINFAIVKFIDDTGLP
jgi:hypothetical protein